MVREGGGGGGADWLAVVYMGIVLCPLFFNKSIQYR